MCLSKIVTKTGYVVPCGKCVECLSRRRSEWSTRMLIEAQDWDFPPLFLTLTYDDDHLPIVNGKAVLQRRDIQLFMKRVRKALNVPIKYFGCGEYGPTTHRPHYHLILFGCPDQFYDLYLKTVSPFCEDFFSEKWQQGYISVFFAKPAAIHYVTKYTLSFNLCENEDENKFKPFTICSKGIGANFFDSEQFKAVWPAGSYQKYKDAVKKFYKSGKHPFDRDTCLAFLAAVRPYLPRNFVTINGSRYPLPRYYRKRIVGTDFGQIANHPFYDYFLTIEALKVFDDVENKQNFGHTYFEFAQKLHEINLKDRFIKKSKV